MKLDKRDEQVQVALWYYNDGLDQNEIGRRLNKSRSMVSRILSEARENGIVEIRINVPERRNPVLEKRLLDCSSLKEVWVLEASEKGFVSGDWALFRLAGTLIRQKLYDGVSVGVAWSRTLYNVISEFPVLSLAKTKVIQLSGSASQGRDGFDGPGLIQMWAHKLNAVYQYLLAPMFVESEDVRNTIMSEESISETLKLAARVDVAIVGIGSLSMGNSGLYDSSDFNRDLREKLISSGAVGDIIGNQYNSAGIPLDREFNNRVIGISLNQLSEIPVVIAVAAGSGKAEAISAGIKGGWFNHLVTDEHTAKEIMHLRGMS